MWSEIDEDTKETMMEAVKNNLIACELEVPSDKVIFKRIQGFYGNRRSMELIKNDPVKKKKDKLTLNQID